MSLAKVCLLGLAILLVTSWPGRGEDQVPQYGGTLTVGSEYSGVPTTSWDPADWHWKANTDALYLDHLLVGDLAKSIRRGGSYHFTSGLWMPDSVYVGDLAESWRVVEEPLSIVFQIRKGVFWPEKPKLMKSRELTAQDVVFSFNRVRTSPKALKGYFEFIDRAEAIDDHTVVFHLKEYNTEWMRRIGDGLYDGILPVEAANFGPLSPKNAIGTGPFMLEAHSDGSATSYVRNQIYWRKLEHAGRSDRLPYLDRLVFPALKDSATAQAALRTGKLDILRNIPWSSVAQLKTSLPKLQWEQALENSGTFIALRMDVKPLDNLLVRRALNMAIDRRDMIAKYYGGNAELFNFPMHRDWPGFFRPLEEMPESVRELFVYDPVKAKTLLTEAGYPDGFTLDVQVNGSNASHLDLLSLTASAFAKIGVKLNIKPMDYASYLAVLKNGRHSAGYIMNSSHLSPIGTLLRCCADVYWNASRFKDPELEQRMRAALYLRNEAQQIKEGREITAAVLAAAPFILLPTAYHYQAWWPWVKNYHGEMFAGALRVGPIYAQTWIDRSMKKAMGF